MDVLPIQTLPALLVVGCFSAGVFHNAFPSFRPGHRRAGASRGVLCTPGVRAVRGPPDDRLTIRSRSSAIRGGQTEWQISPAFLYAVLSLTFAGAMVALSVAALGRSPQRAAKEEGTPASRKEAKPSSKDDTKAATKEPTASEPKVAPLAASAPKETE